MTTTTNQPTGAENIIWDLSDLYATPDDPAIDRDLDEADSRAEALGKQYRGHVAELDAESLRDLLEEFQAVAELSHKPRAYANLNWTTDTDDPVLGALMQKTAERASRISQMLVFARLEWANVPDGVAEKLMNHPVLENMRYWLVQTRLKKPYLLSEPEEKILSEKAVTGRQAWTRFFGEVHSAARYDFDGEQVPATIVLSALFDPDREIHRRANDSMTAGLDTLSRITTSVFNNILADKASDDRLRNYPNWITERNLDNEVSDESVVALIEAVTSRYDIVARYYKLKAKLLDLDELFEYDRYAPLPDADRTYPWKAGREMVLSAFERFHPRIAEVATLFFDQNWIHAPVLANKRGGAYASPVVPSVHPYIFVNYQARPRDVMTLAHELGHGIHMYLSKPLGWFYLGTPITTAETASVFSEMLVFHDLVEGESDPAARLSLLTGKIEDSFATVFRQISLNRFEDAIHTARRDEGELSTERFNELWSKTQRDMFQDSLTISDDYGLWWSYIPHFLDVPGYVYGYAFGELLVQALYARYQEVGADFAGAYLDMLSAGGSNWPHEIVKPLGVDLTDPDFWQQGLQILDDMVSEAETLAAQIQ